MDPLPAQVPSLLYYVTTDPQLMGTIGWAGLIVSIVGFGIAIAQIKKTRSAAVAASQAAVGLVKMVKGREQLVELNTTLAHLDNVKNALTSENAQAAAIYIELASTSIIHVVELMSGSPDEQKTLQKIMVRIRRLAEAVASIATTESGVNNYIAVALEAREIGYQLKGPAARLRYQYGSEG